MDSKLEPVGKIREVNGNMCIKWDIQNYVEFNESGSKNYAFTITSPSFEVLAATWKLVLYPSDVFPKSDSSFRYVSIYLQKYSSKIQNHCIYFLLEMEIHGEVVRSFSSEKTFKEGERYGLEHGLSVRSFPTLGREDTVTIFLYILPTGSTIPAVITSLKSSTSTNMPLEGLGILSTNMEDLYLKQEDCDFMIRVKTREFRVHKAILAARSPVFYSMLHNDMSEKNNGIVEIVDFEPEIFESFLRYLYTGQVDHLSWTNVTELYELGDKYNLQFLKKACTKYLQNGMCFNRFFNILVFVIKHDEQILLEFVKEFFVKNVKAILPSQQWLEFMKENSSVCNDLFMTYVNQQSVPQVQSFGGGFAFCSLVSQ